MKTSRPFIRIRLSVIITCLFCTLLINVFFLFNSTKAFSEREVTFKLNPPDGTTFVETIEYTQSIVEGLPKKESVTSTNKASYVIRKTNSGYYVDVTPLQPSRLRKSDKTMSVLNSIISSLKLTYELNERGQLVRIWDPKRGIKRLENKLPHGMLGITTSAIFGSSKTLKEVIAKMWIQKELLSFMVGKTMKLGGYYTGKVVVPFYGGTNYELMVKTKVRRLQDCGPEVAPFCIYLRSIMQSSDKELPNYWANAMRQMIISTFKMFAANAPSVDSSAVKKAISEVPYFHLTEPKIEIDYERLMDTDTGLTREISIRQSFQANFSINSGEKSKFVFTHDTHAVYDYD